MKTTSETLAWMLGIFALGILLAIAATAPSKAAAPMITHADICPE